MHEYVQYVITGISEGSVYALIGLGFALVYQVTGVINFAQGEFVMLGGLLFAVLEEHGMTAVPAALVAVAVTTATGAAVYLAGLRPARRARLEIRIIITIGIAFVIEGVVLLFVGTDPQYADPFGVVPAFHIAGGAVFPQYVWVVGMAAIAVLLLAWFLGRTLFGKAMRACSMNQRAARLMGIDPDRITLITFALAAVLGAVGGIVLAPIQSPDYQSGLTFSLYGLAAAVLGGLRSPSGAVAGGLVIGLAQSFAAGKLPTGYGDTIVFGLLLVVLLVRPQGLLNRRTAARV
jgi:branched-chain amino acid transport system permease protein